MCKEEFDHKIWGAVLVMMEGAYQVGQSSVEQYDFRLFHLLRGPPSADFRQTYPSRLKLTSLIIRILKALCLDVFVPGEFRVPNLLCGAWTFIQISTQFMGELQEQLWQGFRSSLLCLSAFAWA
jgi:hypothetical protein